MAIPGMDRPPLPGPEISSQMGVPTEQPGEAAGISSIAQRTMGPGGANPHGLLMAQVDAVKKVLDQAAGAEPTFAPFAQRAIQILDSGVSAVSMSPVAGSQQAPTPPPDGGPGMGAPPGGAGQMPPLA